MGTHCVPVVVDRRRTMCKAESKRREQRRDEDEAEQRQWPVKRPRHRKPQQTTSVYMDDRAFDGDDGERTHCYTAVLHLADLGLMHCYAVTADVLGVSIGARGKLTEKEQKRVDDFSSLLCVH